MKSTFANRLAVIGTAAIALGLGVGHAADVTSDFTIPTKVVHYQDLDLSQPRDAQRLYERIHTAAQLVCEEPLLPSVATRAAHQTCIERAVTQAVGQVGSVQLTRIHAAATQREANRG
jgi:UrcA family protein